MKFPEMRYNIIHMYFVKQYKWHCISYQWDSSISALNSLHTRKAKKKASTFTRKISEFRGAVFI